MSAHSILAPALAFAYRSLSMPRYPLQRSLVFWLGLFGLVALLWMTLDSVYHRSRIHVEVPGEVWELSSSSRWLILARHWGVAEPPRQLVDVFREPAAAPSGLRNLHARPFLHREGGSVGTSMLGVSASHLLLLYLPPWLLLLGWRRRAWRKYHA